MPCVFLYNKLTSPVNNNTKLKNCSIGCATHFEFSKAVEAGYYEWLEYSLLPRLWLQPQISKIDISTCPNNIISFILNIKKEFDVELSIFAKRIDISTFLCLIAAFSPDQVVTFGAKCADSLENALAGALKECFAETMHKIEFTASGRTYQGLYPPKHIFDYYNNWCQQLLNYGSGLKKTPHTCRCKIIN